MRALTIQEVLSVINGAWAVAALCLLMVAGTYFIHEWVARRIKFCYWRSQLTQGMRVALAIGGISLGVCVTRAIVWGWRVIGGGGDFSNVEMWGLAAGTLIGLLGFVCAIREYSRPIFGRWVWIASLGFILLTAMATAAPYFLK